MIVHSKVVRNSVHQLSPWHRCWVSGMNTLAHRNSITIAYARAMAKAARLTPHVCAYAHCRAEELNGAGVGTGAGAAADAGAGAGTCAGTGAGAGNGDGASAALVGVGAGVAAFAGAGVDMPASCLCGRNRIPGEPRTSPQSGLPAPAPASAPAPEPALAPTPAPPPTLAPALAHPPAVSSSCRRCVSAATVESQSSPSRVPVESTVESTVESHYFQCCGGSPLSN